MNNNHRNMPPLPRPSIVDTITNTFAYTDSDIKKAMLAAYNAGKREKQQKEEKIVTKSKNA